MERVMRARGNGFRTEISLPGAVRSEADSPYSIEVLRYNILFIFNIIDNGVISGPL